MITIDERNGDLFYEDNQVPKIYNGEGGGVGKNKYATFSVMTDFTDNKPCDVTFHYKNTKLDSISISIDNNYLKNNYVPSKDINFRDYLTPYINFSKAEHLEFLNSILKSKKTNFGWGRIELQTDPRDYWTFIKITYYRS